MELIQHLVPIIFTLSLVALVTSVGFDATLDDVLYLFRRPAQLVKAVLAVNVLVPIAAAILVALFPLSLISKAGIILMAVSPVPPLAPGNELKVGGRRAYSYGLYVALIALAVIIVPVTVAIVGRVYQVDLAIGVVDVARNVVLTVLAPLAIGMLVHWKLPGLAKAVGPWLSKLAMLALVIALVPMAIGAWPAMKTLVGDGTVVAIVLLAAAALAAGHLLGGPDPADRRALAVTAATRHPGIALMIAGANIEDKRVSAAIILVMLIGAVASFPYQLWSKRHAQAAAASPA